MARGFSLIVWPVGRGTSSGLLGGLDVEACRSRNTGGASPSLLCGGGGEPASSGRAVAGGFSLIAGLVGRGSEKIDEPRERQICGD